MKAISNSFRKYIRLYSNWIDICSVAPFCFDVIMQFFPNEFRLDNKADFEIIFKLSLLYQNPRTNVGPWFKNSWATVTRNDKNHLSATTCSNVANLSNCKNFSPQCQFTDSYSNYDGICARITFYGNAFGIFDYHFQYSLLFG